ncbi:MAG: TetR/AcrR family transcriptional regulator [Erysipelotrichaceae bacterium]|nr:TetR/AcrR family transcriptional regulator [Erysipelotrichaceae bacterium]
MNLHTEEHRIAQESMTEALFQLMSQKPFSEITITELVKKAGVARATYYRNYSSREDILKQFIYRCQKAFWSEYPCQTLNDLMNIDRISAEFKYVDRYQELFIVLNKNGLSSLYLDYLNRFYIERFEEILGNALTDEDRLRIYAVAGAEFNVIFNGLISGQASKEEVSKEISHVFEYVLK